MTTSNEITEKFFPIRDKFLTGLKTQWFSQTQTNRNRTLVLPELAEWFQSSKRNNIIGWADFPYTDITMGNTHFIESVALKYKWDYQILPHEYAYHTLMGKMPTNLGQLHENKPLMISLPNWRWADLRPDWPEVLNECERKNIDIHIDCAWMIVAKDIELDLSHPCIKSFALSISKYSMEWNRVGVRWTKQRSMDSITIFNHYYGDVNSALSSAASFIIKQLPIDYGWDNYQHRHQQVCAKHGLKPSKLIHVAHQADKTVGIGNILSRLGPDSI